MLYFSMACVAQSTASCCMSSDMSAFLITAFLSVMVEDDDGRLLGEEGRKEHVHSHSTALKINTARGDGDVFFFLFRPAGSTQTSFFTQTTGRLAPRFFFFPLSSALIHDHNSQPVGFNLCSQLTRWLQLLHRLAAKLDTGGVKLLGQNHFRVKAASASGGQKKSTNKRMNNHVHRTRYALCYRHVHVWAVEML